MAAGDVVIIGFGLNDSPGRGASPTLNGFAAVSDPLISGGGGGDCLSKVVDAGDVSAGSWTFTNLWSAATTGTWGAIAYTGSDGVDISASQASNLSTPAVTPSVDNCMIVASYGDDVGAGGRTGTADASPAATERVDVTKSGEGHTYMQEFLQTTAASVALDFTPTAGSLYAAFILALKPTAAGGGVTLDAPLSNIIVSAFSPQIATGASRDVPVANIVVQVFAPTITVDGVVLLVPLSDIIVTAFAPNLSAGVSLTPPVGDTVVSAFSPDIASGVTLVPPVAETIVIAFTPSFAAGVTLAPPFFDIVVTAFAPNIAAGVSLTPDAGSTRVLAFAPAIDISGNVVLNIPGVGIVVLAFPPDIISSLPTDFLIHLARRRRGR